MLSAGDLGCSRARRGAIRSDRAQAYHRLLRELEAWLGRRNERIDRESLTRFLDEQRAAGAHPNTVRKHLGMLRAHFRREYESRRVSADLLIAVLSVKPPRESTRRTQPQPYRRTELSALWATLDERWPKLDEHEACHWLRRWLDGRSPYSRVRTHMIRCQLDSIIALALYCALRPGEIFRQRMVFMHYDNDYVVVWRQQGPPWEGHYRTVHYTDGTRAMIAPWCGVHYVLSPPHNSPWLALHAEPTVRDAMSRERFDRLLQTYVGPQWTLSRLRATCGVTWAKAGLHPEHLRRVLGYSSVGEVWPYFEQIGGDEARHMDRLDRRFTELVEVA